MRLLPQVPIETAAGTGEDELLGLSQEDAEQIVNSLMAGSPEDPLGLAREFDQEYNSSHLSGGDGEAGQGMEEILRASLLPTDQAYKELVESETPRLPMRTRKHRGSQVNVTKALPPVPQAFSQHGDLPGPEEQEGGDSSESELSEPRYGRAEYANVPCRFTRNTSHNNPRLTVDEQLFLAQSVLQETSRMGNLTLGDTLNASKPHGDLGNSSKPTLDLGNVLKSQLISTAPTGRSLRDQLDLTGQCTVSTSQVQPEVDEGVSQPLIDFGDTTDPQLTHSPYQSSQPVGGEQKEDVEIVDVGTVSQSDGEAENIRAISFHNGTFSEVLERSPAKMPDSRRGLREVTSPHSSNSQASSHRLLDELYEANLQAGAPGTPPLTPDKPSPRGSQTSSRSLGSSSQGSRSQSGSHGSEVSKNVQDFLSSDVDTLIARYRQLRGRMEYEPPSQPDQEHRPTPDVPQTRPIPAATTTDGNLISLSNTPAQTHGRNVGLANGAARQGMIPFSPQLATYTHQPSPRQLPTTHTHSYSLPAQTAGITTQAPGYLSLSPAGDGLSDLLHVPEDLGFPSTPPGEREDGGTLMSSLPMSPHTERLHTCDVQLGRNVSDELWDNILAQDDSLLVPPSPEAGEDD